VGKIGNKSTINSIAEG